MNNTLNQNKNMLSASNEKSYNKVCAVIPFYNEERTIKECVDRTLKFADLVIAVNDGSTDKSAAQIPSGKNVHLLSYKKNRGKGFALKEGFIKSIELGFSKTISLDADLQHPPEYIPGFIKELDAFDIVIGNRLSDLSSMPLQRRMSNKISSYLLGIKTKKKILDSQCGFRAFRTEILSSILPSFPGYEAESEMIILAARNNYTIGYTPIPTIYGKEKSKIKPLQLIRQFAKVMMI